MFLGNAHLWNCALVIALLFAVPLNEFETDCLPLAVEDQLHGHEGRTDTEGSGVQKCETETASPILHSCVHGCSGCINVATTDASFVPGGIALKVEEKHSLPILNRPTIDHPPQAIDAL